MKPRYQINILFSGTGYVATVPDLPRCSGKGSTYQEALSSAEDSIRTWINEAVSAGRPVPAPGSANTSKRRIMPVAPIASSESGDLRQMLDELVTDTYSYRRRRYRSQVGFWERFGVAQSTGSRYERVVGGKVRQIPLPLAILVGLHAMGRVNDSDLAAVYGLLKSHYPGRPHLRLSDE